MMKSAKPLAILLLLGVATIGIDRVTKRLATQNLAGAPTQSYLADTIRLTYTENTGGFLSLGAGMPPGVRTALFTVATGAILLVMAVMAWRHRSRVSQTVAFALFVAGGISNWVDRLHHGHVVDFMNVGIGWLRTGIFNVADVAIMLGVALFIFAELRSKPAPTP